MTGRDAARGGWHRPTWRSREIQTSASAGRTFHLADDATGQALEVGERILIRQATKTNRAISTTLAKVHDSW